MLIENLSGGFFMTKKPKKISKEYIKEGSDESGTIHDENLLAPAEKEVLENEFASLPDHSYSFDEDNTGDEDFHDADEEYAEKFVDFDYDEDFITKDSSS